MIASERIVVVALREDDLCRLHALLACYESPYALPSELRRRTVDEQEHERLRREIEHVLA